MLLKPTGFAVIGASKEKRKVGHAIFKNLLDSGITVYPVNPNDKSILGIKCAKSVTELKGKVSHAVIAVPAPIVPLVVKECGIAGVKYIIIISAGFSEAGNKRLEDEIVHTAREYGMRILGPNVLGIINPGEYNASFYTGVIKSGGIALISQSGALGVAILDLFKTKGWGLRSFISIGNMSDISTTDVLNELIDDPKTKTIMIYSESLKNGKEFMNACMKSTKPVFILKSGTSSEGSKAASSHTGALAGSDEVYSAAFKQCGAIRVKSITELLNAGLLSEKYGMLGNNALIITNAGGPGILMTDALASKGIKIPSLPEALTSELNKNLQSVAWSRNNPIDLVGDAPAERYEKTLELIKKHNFYDYVIVLLTPQSVTQPIETAQAIIKYAKETNKPIIPCFMGGDSVKESKEQMEKEGLIVMDRIEDVSNSLALIKK